MDLESARSVRASMGDVEEFKNDNGVSEVENNGSCEIGINGSDGLFRDVKGKGTEALVSVSSPPVEMKSDVSQFPSTSGKGKGLKKWRRIKRDVSKGGDSSDDTVKMVRHELSNSVVNPSKRAQIFAERPQKSEGSVSSVNPVFGNFDVFGDSGFAMGSLVDAGTDSENSENSVPKMKYEIPVGVGFPNDKMRIRSLSGKNLTQSTQRGQQGKGRIEATKKARGERVKIEKENSRSSMESDLRSSNFVFMQGTSNGIQSEGLVHQGGENGHGVQGSDRRFDDGPRGGYSRDSDGGYEDLSWDLKNERGENHGSSSDQDPLVASILLLQTAQEALEEEVLKFKEIGKVASADDSVADTHPDFTNLENSSSEQFISGEAVLSFSRALLSEAELEDLFKQRIEAEVEYLTLSRTVQKLTFAAVDQNTILEEQKAPASELMTDKTTTLKKENDKLRSFCEDIATVDETLKLQKRVCKYTSYFLMQILSLLIVFGVFIFQLSPNYVEFAPT